MLKYLFMRTGLSHNEYRPVRQNKTLSKGYLPYYTYLSIIQPCKEVVQKSLLGLILLSTMFFSLAFSLQAQDQNARWLRYPAISPDGKQIVFSYKGDLFLVASEGGKASPLTIHPCHNTMPVWSPDGKHIAFASDRYGNFDVFIMPSGGGKAQRLTHHSSNDIPWDFSIDGKEVIFSSSRNDLQSSVRFPNRGLFGKLYAVAKEGGRDRLISTAGFQHANFDQEGKRIIFQDRKGYEDEWRKHHTSSVTRDIWVYDLEKESYTKVSDYEGEDREPVFSANGNAFYYLSEKNGDQNIFKRSLEEPASENQLSFYEKHPVRHLSRSNTDRLCYTWNGDIYTLDPNSNADARMVEVRIQADFMGEETKNVPVSQGVNEMALSPNGKEVAFVFRGEVFVTSVDGKMTKRITHSPEQERMLSWGKDGKTLYYSTERGDSWDIYRASLERPEEDYFFAATLIKEEPIIATDKEEFQPLLSPDGEHIAYLEERNILKVYSLKDKSSKTIIPEGENFSYADGDQDYTWSPDSKWLVARNALQYFGNSNLVAYSIEDPKKVERLTYSGFFDGSARFMLEGKALVWVNDKDGKKPLAFQGAREVDLYAMFFDQESFDRFQLSKEEFELLKEKEEKEKKEDKEEDSGDKKKKKKKKGEEKDEKEKWDPDFSGIEYRQVRLTPGSMNLAGYDVKGDGSAIYFLAKYEKDFDLWELDTRTKELKTLAKLGEKSGGAVVLSDDEKFLVVLAGGKLSKVEVSGGKQSPISIDTEMVLNQAGEREYIFHHAWRQVKKKFYDPDLHGIDWEMYRENYAQFLPHINNNYDFQELLSELLGELNGSHTGGRFFQNPSTGDETASLGLFFDEKDVSNGLKITEVITGGPLDRSESKVKAGHVIEKIDGESIASDTDWPILLNRKKGKNVLLSLYDAQSGKRWQEKVKPISMGEENSLLYKRWVRQMRDMTEKLSDGKVGYVHVQGMNDNSFRDVYAEVLGRNQDKEALIVDTRFNGGGWLHEDLTTFLDGKPYAIFRPYGQKSKGGEPRDKWSKPSVVLMSESNYSDAHAFPYAYRAKGIGKLVGMPVPGTSTAVWWERQIDPTIVFGIPMIAFYGIEEDRPLENLQLEPDVKVPNPFEAILNGEDPQLKKSVEVLLEEINRQD